MKSNKHKYLLLILPALLLSVQGWAQTGVVAAEEAVDLTFYDRLFTNMILILAGIVILAAISSLTYLLNIMVKVEQIKMYQEQGIDISEAKADLKPRDNYWQRIYRRWTAVVPVEKEKDIMFDHEYDGIRELDNSLPPWWVAMFYVTIAFAGIYMFVYHWSDLGMSSTEAYEMEVKQAEEDVRAYLATQSDLVDETNATLLAEDQALAVGATIFQSQCAACHGALGEGGVGPNFADQYWIHGGDIKDLFRTIKYGVPEKGMISWKAQLSPKDMQRVASYILTLQGTDPPNQKSPEGELYQPAEVDDADAPAEGEPAAGEEEATIGMKEETQE